MQRRARRSAEPLGGMSDDGAHLWKRALAQFEFHRQNTDPTALDAMNRIAQKCLYLAERPSFSPENCTIRAASLTRTELSQLKRFHPRTKGYPSLEPVVVIESGSDLVVVEGNTRVNRWLEEGREGPFPTLIVAPAAA
jgi:hypothetical protein